MKKILLFIITFFIALFFNLNNVEASLNNGITIYRFNGDSSLNESTDFVASDLFTEEIISLENLETYRLQQDNILPGWKLIGFYKPYSDKPELIPLDTLIMFEQGTDEQFVYYEWWVKQDFSYYIYYNQNSLPQEFHINENLTFEEFLIQFPTSYKNYTTDIFYNDSNYETEITLSELYDIYFNSLVDGPNYHTIYAKFNKPIVDKIQDGDVKDDINNFLNNPEDVFIFLIILVIIAFALSLFGTSRYRKYKRRR